MSHTLHIAHWNLVCVFFHWCHHPIVSTSANMKDHHGPSWLWLIVMATERPSWLWLIVMATKGPSWLWLIVMATEGPSWLRLIVMATEGPSWLSLIVIAASALPGCHVNRHHLDYQAVTLASCLKGLALSSVTSADVATKKLFLHAHSFSGWLKLVWTLTKDEMVWTFTKDEMAWCPTTSCCKLESHTTYLFSEHICTCMLIIVNEYLPPPVRDEEEACTHTRLHKHDIL